MNKVILKKTKKNQKSAAIIPVKDLGKVMWQVLAKQTIVESIKQDMSYN